MLKPRQKKLIRNLDLNGYNVKQAAVDAGYSPMYADKQGKKLLKSALKAKVKETLEILEPNTPNSRDIGMIEAKALMLELVGLSREELLLTLKKIATQDKDYSSALKVLMPLAKEIGIALQEGESKTIVPILNIGVREISPTMPLTGVSESVIEAGGVG